ncbi:lipopolysaccharide biosynthesis protein [Alkalitalea saponilacus]|uniref:Membrane protein involved in the export of O-antigen and teichoic acid n=1 Tax=Alkalitalea saponilacus TaxID=889453 RepID=A0A1T5DI30_9BACT|nr:oligosaccharide flippase family protein [Alkalitalea saponilacus]ASB50704.1 O-antigen translocase [Alkalitalea saponilacus]SKB71326.1 Membrane protein involved in the export of O-antigen and teichoic acid [Alkalitalea saponilacus]
MAIRNKIKKVIANQNLKFFLTLLSGSAIAQGIVFLITPVLSRVYTDEMFGTLTLFSSITLTLSTVVALRYELSILLPKREKDAVSLLILCFIIITVLSLVTLFIIILYHEFFNGLFDNGGLGRFIFLLPLGVFLHGMFNTLTYWLNRQKKFKSISFVRINKSISMSSVQLINGFSALQYLGLIPGLIAGQLMGFLHTIYSASKSIRRNAHHISINRILLLAKRYQKIPKYNTLLTFTNTLSNELPNILIPKYFGLAIGGQFGLAVRLIKTPIGLISEAVSQIFFNKASETYNNEPSRFHELVKQTYIKLFFLALTGFPLLFVSTYFFEYILGSEWTETGIYSRLLIPWLFLMFLNSPISSLIVILGKQRSLVIYDLLLLLLRLTALILGYHYFYNIIYVLVLYSMVGMIFNSFLIFYFIKLSKQADQEHKYGR